MNEDKATRYHRVRRRAAFGGRAAVLVCLTLLVVSGAGRWLAGIVERLTDALPASWMAATVIYVAVCVGLLLAARFPFDLFREWTLERRYGLEREPLAEWLRSHARGAVLRIAVLCGAAVLLRAAAFATGEAWWLVAATLFGLAHVGWTAAAPLTLSLSGGLHPIRHSVLAARLKELARRTGSTLQVVEWRGGDDSRRAHAALAGLGWTGRIILSDTLLGTLTEDEIEVVVAHEIAHHVHGDVWRGVVWRYGVWIAALGTAAAALASFTTLEPGELAALPPVALTAACITGLLAPAGLALSRRHELRADAYALALTGKPEAFITSMRRLSANNLLEDRPSRLTRLLSSHPTVQERLSAALMRK
ncbi:MAG TPA: M48 family metalloprotease [Vicinamibacterales bacterium]